MSLSQPQPPSPPLDDDELQMRRALGLFGATPKPRPEPERTEQPSRGPGGGAFMQGGMHRRRFVQDGEVPVTVVRRDDPAANPLAPQSSRLQRVEAALAAETAARERAERALQESQATVQALRTKIGHAELEKNEALAASKRDREELAALREDRAAQTASVKDDDDRTEELEAEIEGLRADLASERRARERAERLLAETSADLDRLKTAPPAAPKAAKATRRGQAVLDLEPEPEGEPVKWWLPVAKAPAKAETRAAPAKAARAAAPAKAARPAAKAKPGRKPAKAAPKRR